MASGCYVDGAKENASVWSGRKAGPGGLNALEFVMKIDSLTVVNSIMLFGIALVGVALRNTIKGNRKLEKEISDRVRKKAEEIFETPQAAQLWMHKPHPVLEGQTPDDALRTPEGAKRVRDILVSIRRGGVV